MIRFISSTVTPWSSATCSRVIPYLVKVRTRPSWEKGNSRVSRLTVALCRIGFGSAGASTFAVLIGRCGGIAKIRGCR